MSEFVSCIVAAGGSGTRMGVGINKLFLEIDDVPVIAHTLSALETSEEVSEIVIAAREDEIMYISEIVSVYGITKAKTIVKGGKTRAESVLSASREVSPECDLVMIHDGARPFITAEIIAETVNKAREFGAAACGVKPKCTLKSIEMFDRMYSLDDETLKSATDDCVLAEKCGAEIFVIEGSYKNIKITTPEDMIIASAFLKRI